MTRSRRGGYCAAHHAFSVRPVTHVPDFVAKHSSRIGRRIDGVTEDALETLGAYDWPGNVRELENTIERAVVLSKGATIDRRSISILGVTPPPSSALPSMELKKNLAWAERESVERALRQAGGMKKRAAVLLGISQRALSYCLSKYSIE